MERSPLYFQFVSQHPRAIEEDLPYFNEAQATVLLAFDKGEVQEVYLGLYFPSEACLVEYVLPHYEMRALSKGTVIDRDAALSCARQKARVLASLR